MIGPLAFGQRSVYSKFAEPKYHIWRLNEREVPNENVFWQNPETQETHFAVLTDQKQAHCSQYRQAVQETKNVTFIGNSPLLQDRSPNSFGAQWTQALDTLKAQMLDQVDKDITTLPEAQLAAKYQIEPTRVK